MKTKKIASRLISVLLILGVVITIGFLSFTGMLLITPYIGIAAASFFFAVIVEGEVYKQNIFAGVKKLFSKDFMKKRLRDHKLAKCIKNPEYLRQSQFLRDYKEQQEYVYYLKLHNHDSERYHFEKKRLKMMKKFFSDFLFSEGRDELILSGELHKIISTDEKDRLKKELLRKHYLNCAMGIFYVLAGVSCAFASFSSIHTGAIVLMSAFGITLAPTLLFAGIIPLGILAGIGYSVLMYHTVSDMIANDTIKKVFKKLEKFFHRERGTHAVIFYLKAASVGILVGLLIGLCVFATIATAGTWWIAAKQGARLIPYIAAAANWIRNISIPAMTLPAFLFNLKNSLTTLEKLGKFSLKNLTDVWKDIKETKASENPWQFVNPFRLLIKIIEIPVKIFTFSLHLASVAVMSDNLEPLPPALTSALLVKNEALIDAHYFMEKSHDHHHDHHHHHHHHHHGTIVNKLLLVVLFPVHLLSATWDWATARKNSNPPTFKDSLLKSLGIAKPKASLLQEVPQISDAWKHYEIISKLKKEERRYKQAAYNTPIAKQKCKVIAALKEEIEATSVTDVSYAERKPIKEVIKQQLAKPLGGSEEQGNALLTQHRSRFFSKKESPAHSRKFIDEILKDESYDSLVVSV